MQILKNIKRERMKILIVAFTLLSFGVFLPVAEAKKFGGGGSFGHSKKVTPKNHNSKPANNQTQKDTQAGKTTTAAGAAGAAGATSGAAKWLGPIAGLAAGGLLAAMIFGDGFEGIQAFDLLLIALVALMLFALFKRRRSQVNVQSQYRQAESSYRPEPNAPQQQYRQSNASSNHGSYNPNSTGSIIGSGLSESAVVVAETPAWFNESEFIVGAKGHYVAVQKAWDDLNVAEIKSYCSEELFEAIQVEMQGMSPGSNYTEVEDLYAEVADMTVDGDSFIVSVRFSGFIKEGKNEMAHSFNEIWHIARSSLGEGDWKIVGIQQSDDG